MSEHNWIPKGRVPLHTLIKGVRDYTVANAERFGMNKTTRIGDWFKFVYLEKYDPYDNNFGLWQDPATRSFIITEKLAKDEKEIFPLFLELCSLLKANPLVEDADLAAMNLSKRSANEHHPAPVADKAPAFDILPVEGHRLRIYFYHDGSAIKKGKPEGQHGAEIKYGFTDNPSVEPEDLPESTFDTASPYTLTFHVADAGKRVGVALRRENSCSLKGPWCTVEFVFVP